MIDKNSIYCGLYTIVDEFKSHLSASDLEIVRKESFVKSRSYKDIINKSCEYCGFTIATLRTIAEYIESAAFGYICIAKTSDGIQKRYYSDSLKKCLQNALGIANDRYFASEIAERTGISKHSLQLLFSLYYTKQFEAVTPSYWITFQKKLNIRIFVCMRYGHNEVFGQGVQFSNPFAKGDVVLRFSKSHDYAQELDPFFDSTATINQLPKEDLAVSNEEAVNEAAINDVKTPSNDSNTVIDTAQKDSDLLEAMNRLTPEQFIQLQTFASSLYSFDVKRAILFEAHCSNQIDAICAFIKAIQK